MHWFLHPPSRRLPRAQRFRPHLEVLEDRTAPATFGSEPTTLFTNPASLQVSNFQNPASSAASNVATSVIFENFLPTAFNGTTLDFGGALGQLSSPLNVAVYMGSSNLPLSQFQYGPAQSAFGPYGETSSLFEYSPFSLATLVPPQVVPPRAVTPFAPSGGGGAAAAGQGAQNQQGPNKPGQGPGAVPNVPGTGTPPAPGTPGNQQAPGGQGGSGGQPAGTKPPAPEPSSFQDDLETSRGEYAAWVEMLADPPEGQENPFGEFLAGEMLGQRIPDEVLAGPGN